MSNSQSSNIFVGSRVLGRVSTQVPFIARFIKRRSETLLVTSVGHWFYTYGSENLRLLSISGKHQGAITCMAGDSYHIYTASEHDIFAWRRGTEIKHTYKGHNADIHLLMAYGTHLISVDKTNVLKIFKIQTEEEYSSLQYEIETFKITAMIHPLSCLNKILLGSEQGELQLWNIETMTLVHKFNGFKSPIGVLENAPAAFVIAAALASGTILLYNIKYGKVIMEFKHHSLVTSLSFRMDGAPIMITGLSNGHLVFWDLEEKRSLSIMESAHSSAVCGLQCLMSEPIMISNSDDNSIKVWIFDMPNGGVRLLRKRDGHSSPPTVIHFCEPTGENLLSAGIDGSLHILNTVTETFNKNLGKAYFNRQTSAKNKKPEKDMLMLPIVKISSCIQKDKQWDSIATVHQDTDVVATWSYNKMKCGDHRLKPPNLERGAIATCLTITHCGNYVIVGYSSGEVHKFNIQSGIHRGCYSQGTKYAHKGSIRGVATDICNERVITVGADNELRLWYFRNEIQLICITKLEESVSFIKYDRESGLLALANEDFTISLIDVSTTNIVRKFAGHRAQINDITFDNQSRWLISCSQDGTICTWYIPSSQLIDIFSVEDPCTSLSMSPTNEYLATTHVGEIGVFLWANMLLHKQMSLKPLIYDTSKVPMLELPSTSNDLKNVEKMEIDESVEEQYISPDQISEQFITLSGKPTSQWFNILHLVDIKKRNTPKAPVTISKTAPFFLPSTSTSQPGPSHQENPNDSVQENEDNSRVILSLDKPYTVFATQLMACESDDDYIACLEALKSFSQSTVHLEIQSMSPTFGGSFELLEKFMDMMIFMLNSKKDFELVNSYLNYFLIQHKNTISAVSDLRNKAADITTVMTKSWPKLQETMFQNLCSIKIITQLST